MMHFAFQVEKRLLLLPRPSVKKQNLHKNSKTMQYAKEHQPTPSCIDAYGRKRHQDISINMDLLFINLDIGS